MKNGFYDRDWTEKIGLPIKRVADRWEFFYGGDIPVADGTVAQLTLPTRAITDEAFKQRVAQQLCIQVLPHGSPLVIALSDHSLEPRQTLLECYPPQAPVGSNRFEIVRLGPLKPQQRGLLSQMGDDSGGLWLKVTGLERCELVSGTVLMPDGFEPPTASSLNHALTLLSERYERHRISHTGNVYTRVFYQESTLEWLPLDVLRSGVLGCAERKLLHSAWKEVEEKLGWRPPPPRQHKNAPQGE